ncbi:MAG TPA: hypothetical protein VLJ59_06770 [Mycobacteriales bacterium]|nr:hypothetical protein [Mycobacteriales bacterium]
MTTRITISVPDTLAELIKLTATKEGLSVSGWVSQAIEHEAVRIARRQSVEEWEAGLGPIPAEDLAAMRAELAAAHDAMDHRELKAS